MKPKVGLYPTILTIGIKHNMFVSSEIDHAKYHITRIIYEIRLKNSL